MPRSASVRALLPTVILIACGGAETPGAEAPTSDAPAEAPAAERAPGDPINAFEFTPTGEDPVSELPTAAELTLSGGCGPEGLSIGFLSGTPTDDGYFYFSIETRDPVVRDQTGVVESIAVVWDNGVIRPESLPADSPIRVPRRLEGTGTLTLQSHTGRGMGGHMTATVEGTVADGDADPVSIEVSYDINLACVG